MKFDAENKIQEFIECAIAFTAYDRVDRILHRSAIDAKKNAALGKKIAMLEKQFIKFAPDEFIKLLDEQNLAVAEVAAECLYPLYPKKCIKILKEYSDTLSEDLEKYRVKTLIEAYETEQKFCMDIFRKFYGCDDLSALNRE